MVIYRESFSPSVSNTIGFRSVVYQRFNNIQCKWLIRSSRILLRWTAAQKVHPKFDMFDKS